MKTNTAITAIALLFSGMAYAQMDNSISGSSLKSLKAAKPSGNACVNLEATFSEPLQTQPNAILETDESSMIDGVLSFILSVRQLGPKQYVLSMNSDNAENCALLKKASRKVSVTIDGARGSDGKALLPEQKTFSTRSLF